jgi:hypothetical protein
MLPLHLCVAAAIVEQGPFLACAAADHFADEDRVIAARAMVHGGALDVREHVGDDRRAGDTTGVPTSGGSRLSEQNALTVMPWSSPSESRVVTTVTPLAKRPRIARKLAASMLTTPAR